MSLTSLITEGVQSVQEAMESTFAIIQVTHSQCTAGISPLLNEVLLQLRQN